MAARIFRYAVPIYDIGNLVVVLVYFSLSFLAMHDNINLLISTYIGSYVGLLTINILLGLYPDSCEIDRRKIDDAAKFLDGSPNLLQISDLVWSPRRYRSDFWKSSRICIVDSGKKSILLARHRDIRAVLNNIGGSGVSVNLPN